MQNFSFWSECPLMIQHLVSPERSSNYLPLMFVQRQKIFEKSKANLKFYFLPFLFPAFFQIWLADFFFFLLFYLKLQSRQGNIYFSCFLCILFSPPPAPLFGKGFAVIRNGILLTCGSPPVQKGLTENDKCKQEDTDDSYGAHEHCVHVQI